MIGVIVKDKGVIVSKDVYGGDSAESMKIIAQKQQGNKALTFEVYDDSDPNWKTSFESSTVNLAQTEWLTEKAKGTDAAIDYIAKRLGLE